MAEWLSRQPRDQTNRAKPEKGKIAGGLRARRGSNPFPGAINILWDKPPAWRLFGFSKDFSFVVVTAVLKAYCGSSVIKGKRNQFEKSFNGVDFL